MRTFTVSGLNTYIKGMIDDEVYLENIALNGEISSLCFSGINAYFYLCDAASSISCIFFKSVVKNLNGGASEFGFKNGDMVQVCGSLSYYVKTGKLSFVVSECVLKGKGSKQQDLERLKKDLLNQGIFDKKRALPPSISRVAVITSVDGAVIHDILNVTKRRNKGVDISLFPVRVQGVDAAFEIARAVAEVNECGGFDVLIVARGGGSEEDLSPFNSEEVARAVFNSRIVTVSAVGHEVNYTLCDFAADFRAPTPSAAAELAVPLLSLQYDMVFDYAERIKAASEELLLRASSAFSEEVSRVSLACERKNVYARKLVDLFAQRLSVLSARRFDIFKAELLQRSFAINGGAERLYADRQSALSIARADISAKNPSSLLMSGYAKIVNKNGVVDGVGGLRAGESVEIYMVDGCASAEIVDIKKSK